MGFGYAPAIKAVRKLSRTNEVDEFQVLTCFIKEMPKKSQLSYSIYHDILSFIKIEHPVYVTECLKILPPYTLLTKENFNSIKAHNQPVEVAKALSMLNTANLLTQENRDTLKGHAYPVGVAMALPMLNAASILTQENFDQLLNPANSFLCTYNGAHIWAYIAPYLFKQTIFDQLILYAQQPTPRLPAECFITNLLWGNDDTLRAAINNNQSTHTTSIHASVSESAIKLWTRYGAQLSESKVIEIITTIENDVSNLPNTLQNKAAKTCIERISQHAFVDPSSKVSTRQLLALFYLAMNDDKTRLGSLEDAKKQFIIGLYEIQRGYNLSVENVDDGEEDKVICTAGTFNKLIEKLAGVHPDVELVFITKTTMAAKLSIIVCEEAKSYLNQLSSSEALSDLNNLSNFVKLISQIQKDGIEVIWQPIQPKIADRFFDEFGS